MARVKVRLADNIARVVFIETDATRGATLGTNLFTPDGAVGTPASIRQWLGITGSGASGSGGGGGTQNHRLLAGLTLGNDHPQYPLKAANETIPGYYSFTAGGMELIGATGWGLYFQDVSAAPDEEWWAFESATTTGDFAIFAANDAFSVKRNAWAATRGAGATIDLIAYGNPTDDPQHFFHGFTWFRDAIEVEFGYIGLANDGATNGSTQWFYNLDFAANQKYWVIGNADNGANTSDGSTFGVYSSSDAYAFRAALEFEKAGNAIATATLGNATDNPDIFAYSGAVEGRLGTYTWLTADSDGAAGVNGTYLTLDSDIYSEFLLRAFDNDNYGPTMTFYKSRGTKASPLQTLSGDQLGGFYYGARHNAGGWHFPAAVDFVTSSDCTAGGGVSGYLALQTGVNFAGLAARIKAYTNGDIALRGPLLLGAAEDVGTAGQVLTSQGPGLDPIWAAGGGGGGGYGGIIEIIPGAGIAVDNTDPDFPVVSSTGVLSVVAGANVTVDNTDPQNPVVSAAGGGGYGGAEYLYQLLDVDVLTLPPRLGDQLIYDGAKWITFSPRNFHYLFEDFTYGPYGTSGIGLWDTINSGTGSSVQMTASGAVEGTQGVVLCTTGTTTTGYGGLMRNLNAATSSVGGYYIGRGEVTFRALIQVSANATAANNYFLRIGLMDEITGAPAQGVYISMDASGAYVDGGGNGTWVIAARDGTLTYGASEAGNFAPTPNTWYLAEMVIAADGLSAQLFIDGVLVGTATANFPINTQSLYPAVQIAKGSGTTGVNLRCDYVEIITRANRK